jgi:hypothetical protein
MPLLLPTGVREDEREETISLPWLGEFYDG